MRSATRYVVTALALLLAAAGAGAGGDHNLALQLRQEGVILPLERLVDAAQHVHAGHVLETELKHAGDDYVYEIEILDRHGVVWEMRLDARTGELISAGQGH